MSQKTTVQSKRPRKAPSNQTGGTAWGKKAAAAISGKMQSADVKKLILLNFPYIIAFYMVEKAAWLYRYCNGDTIVDTEPFRTLRPDAALRPEIRHPAAGAPHGRAGGYGIG